jgi:hypothetical protein
MNEDQNWNKKYKHIFNWIVKLKRKINLIKAKKIKRMSNKLKKYLKLKTNKTSK